MQAAASTADASIRAAQRGDPGAWRTLLSEHGPVVFAICRRLDPDPEDAYQVIWEKVVGALHRFDPRGPRPLRSWITTIAHRTLVDRHRRRAVRNVVVPFAEPPEPQDAGDLEGGVDQARRVEHLERALTQLPETQRRVIVLHHLHGHDLPDIARTEGVAIGTLKSRLHRGRARLQVLLGGTP